MEQRGRIFFWVVVAIAATLLLIRLDAPPLSDPDEARFARTTFEMSENGDLVIPTFQGKPRLAKPPLLHWLQMALFQVFGAHGWVARLPAALATLGSLVLVGWVARRRFGEEGAAWAAAIFMTLPLVLIIGRIGTTDALLSVHVFAALALDMVEPDEDRPLKAASIGALLGLAFLAKGPVGVVLPLLGMLAGRTATGRSVVPSLRATLAFLTGWSIVAVPWMLAFAARLSLATAWDTVRGEVLERYFAGTSHVKPAWYFLVIVLVGFAPWVGPMVLGIVRAFRQRRDPAARTALYAAAALVVGVLFFSLGKGKLPQYILPLAPLVALVVTWELARELEDPRRRRLGMWLLTATLVLLAAVLAAAAVVREEFWERASAIVAFVGYTAGTVVALVGAIGHRPRMVYGATAAATALLLLIAGVVIHPAVGEYRSTRPLVERVPELTSDRPVIAVAIDLPSLTWYLDRETEKIPVKFLPARLERDDDPVLIVADLEFPRLSAELRSRLHELGRAGKLRAFEVLPASP